MNYEGHDGGHAATCDYPNEPCGCYHSNVELRRTEHK